MKKSLRYLLTLILALGMVLTTAGCSASFDNAGYVQSTLDCLYKGDVTRYSTLTNRTKEEAASDHQTFIDNVSDSTISSMGFPYVSDESYEKFSTCMENIFKNAKYEVKALDKDGNVEVVVYPINIFKDSDADLDAYVTDFIARGDNGDFDDYDEESLYSEYLDGVTDTLNSYLDKITYADPVTLTVNVYLGSDDLYTISDEDYLEIEDNLINFNY